MAESIQIFVYNAKSINGNNNYPILLFKNNSEIIEFVSNLQYETIYENVKNEGHFVINNPFLLPAELLQIHYRANVYYPIAKNIHLFKSMDICNNTSEPCGFTVFIKSFTC